MDRIVFGIRKAAHVTEYAILAMLASRALRRGRTPTDSVPSLLGTFPRAWGIAASYAALDEFHQTFVPTRTGCWQDVVIDSTGAALGLVLLWLCATLRQRIRSRSSSRN